LPPEKQASILPDLPRIQLGATPDCCITGAPPLSAVGRLFFRTQIFSGRMQAVMELGKFHKKVSFMRI